MYLYRHMSMFHLIDGARSDQTIVLCMSRQEMVTGSLIFSTIFLLVLYGSQLVRHTRKA